MLGTAIIQAFKCLRVVPTIAMIPKQRPMISKSTSLFQHMKQPGVASSKVPIRGLAITTEIRRARHIATARMLAIRQAYQIAKGKQEGPNSSSSFVNSIDGGGRFFSMSSGRDDDPRLVDASVGISLFGIVAFNDRDDPCLSGFIAFIIFMIKLVSVL